MNNINDESNEDENQVEPESGTNETEANQSEEASSLEEGRAPPPEGDAGDERKKRQWEDAPSSTPELEDIARESAKVTEEILAFFPKIESPQVKWSVEKGSIWVEIEGDPSGRLIGRRGKTIEAFQHILSKIISHRLRKRITIHLDAEGYMRRQRDKLEKLALQTADYVAATDGARALEPMSPADRRIVHMVLKDRGDVTTASEGRDQERFVVIWPRGED